MIKNSRFFVFALLALGCVCQNRLWAEGKDEARPLLVLTYNIHHGEGVDERLDLERIARVVQDSSADLVALQEVDRMTERTGKVDQVQELAKLAEMHSAFAKFMDYQGGEYGLAILSRWPIEHSWTIPLPPGKHEPRSALAVRVEHPTLGKITFVCLHFDWLEEDGDRFAQAQSLLASILDLRGTVILAGDFNDLPDSRALRLLSSEFSDVPKPPGAGWTFPATDPDRQIDYVMYRSPMQLEANARVLDEPVASDHRPVLAELRSSSSR